MDDRLRHMMPLSLPRTHQSVHLFSLPDDMDRYLHPEQQLCADSYSRPFRCGGSSLFLRIGVLTVFLVRRPEILQAEIELTEDKRN